MQIVTDKGFIQNLKATILQSRYVAARLENKELLNLYFQTGKIIDEQINENEWGAKIIDKISNDLQCELPGLRGFSTRNLRKIRVFYNEWKPFIQISSLATNQLLPTDKHGFIIGTSVKNQFVEL